MEGCFASRRILCKREPRGIVFWGASEMYHAVSFIGLAASLGDP